MFTVVVVEATETVRVAGGKCLGPLPLHRLLTFLRDAQQLLFEQYDRGSQAALLGESLAYEAVRVDRRRVVAIEAPSDLRVGEATVPAQEVDGDLSGCGDARAAARRAQIAQAYVEVIGYQRDHLFGRHPDRATDPTLDHLARQPEVGEHSAARVLAQQAGQEHV